MTHAAAEAARPTVDLAELRTLAMFEARAEAVLPVDAFAYASGGSSSEATLERNRQTLRHLAIEQRVLMNVTTVDTRAYFLGMALPSPIIVSPMGGMPRFHPEGDLEMARGATRNGGMTVVAGGCSWPLETIGAAATGPLMFQLYWLGDRDWVSEKLHHVHAGGFKAFCLTVDSAAYSRRERDILLNADIQRRRGPLPDTQSGLTWDDVDWVRAQLPLPFGLKGIMTAQDNRAVSADDMQAGTSPGARFHPNSQYSAPSVCIFTPPLAGTAIGAARASLHAALDCTHSAKVNGPVPYAFVFASGPSRMVRKAITSPPTPGWITDGCTLWNLARPESRRRRAYDPGRD